jgi:hypothetical protein
MRVTGELACDEPTELLSSSQHLVTQVAQTVKGLLFPIYSGLHNYVRTPLIEEE